ncbi:hypothetical protein SBA2_450139 [Acidobacteriia bacterium SbA2]|nr:hypothetical protein SBA2_450139 [Acidobacteriia bacterium SbA2]
MREQSENVYENKGTVQKSTTPDPSLSEEGAGVVGLCDLCVLCTFA